MNRSIQIGDIVIIDENTVDKYIITSINPDRIKFRKQLSPHNEDEKEFIRINNNWYLTGESVSHVLRFSDPNLMSNPISTSLNNIRSFTGKPSQIRSNKECYNVILTAYKYWENIPLQEEVTNPDKHVNRLIQSYVDKLTIAGLIYSLDTDNIATGLIIVGFYDNTSNKDEEGYQRPCWIKWLVVDPNKRGSGIGKEIMTAADQWFRDNISYFPPDTQQRKNRHNIYVESIPKAVRFYEANGYQVIGTDDIVDFSPNYFSAGDNAIMAKKMNGYVNLDHKNLDREKLFIEDSNIIEGRNFNAASGFLMGILPRLPQEEYCAWWNKHKDFMNIIGVVSRSVTSYRDSDFTTICRKLKTCMTDHVKITGHKIKVYKGHGMKARIMMYNFVDLDSISSDKKLAMDDVFETIIDLTEE